MLRFGGNLRASRCGQNMLMRYFFVPLQDILSLITLAAQVASKGALL